MIMVYEGSKKICAFSIKIVAYEGGPARLQQFREGLRMMPNSRP